MNYNDHPVVKEIRRLAAENPDHVDPNSSDPLLICRYFSYGKPSCIVGHMMSELYPSKYLPGYEGCGAREVFDSLDQGIPVGVMDWVERVQDNQDSGFSWSEAVASADQHHPL